MRAQPGAELACRGHNYDFPTDDGTRTRGVISYYATKALPGAATVGDWLARMQTLAEQDVAAGLLPKHFYPELRIVGDARQPLSGHALKPQT